MIDTEYARENMTDDELTLSFEELLREVGLLQVWEARAEEKKATEIAQNILIKGFSDEQTAKLSGLDITKVKALSCTMNSAHF